MTGKTFVSNKKIIALCLATILFATPILSQEVVNDYVQGRKDGRREGAADASLVWIIPGVCCGCFGIGAAYFWPQAVSAARLVGRSPDYVRGYTSGYKSARRERQTIYAAIGCLVGDIVYYIGQAIYGASK